MSVSHKRWDPGNCLDSCCHQRSTSEYEWKEVAGAGGPHADSGSLAGKTIYAVAVTLDHGCHSNLISYGVITSNQEETNAEVVFGQAPKVHDSHLILRVAVRIVKI